MCSDILNDKWVLKWKCLIRTFENCSVFKNRGTLCHCGWHANADDYSSTAGLVFASYSAPDKSALII